MTTLSQLNYESTLGSLPLHDLTVSPDVPGQAIAREFEQNPNLPGILVMDGAALLGMVSRRKFLEQMSLPYSLELYLKRPVRVLLDFIEAEPLQLPSACKINKAVQQGLQRPLARVYEPIVVVSEDGSLGLLDFQKLLLAQSRILVMINNVMKQQRTQIRQYLDSLQQEQRKVQEYARLLETNQAEIQQRNTLLESQKAELVAQAVQISQLNQRFLQIGQLLSEEGKKAFQATFEGAKSISQNTNQIVEIGDELAKQLDKIQEASQLIERVSRQVRHLAVQAAVVVNQSGSEVSGFSQIASEISKLVSQTFEAGRQVEVVARDFRFGILNLTQAAAEGTAVAQALGEQVQKASSALAELEVLVRSQVGGDLVDGDRTPDDEGSDLVFGEEVFGMAFSEPFAFD